MLRMERIRRIDRRSDGLRFPGSGQDIFLKGAARRFAAPFAQAINHSMEKVNLIDAFSSFDDHWSPKIVAELNGQHVKVAKLLGEFVWHSHENEDELFLVHRGRLRMEFRDHTVVLEAGDLMVVPRGVEHRPVADEEVQLVLFEPAGTLNTGNVLNERTVRQPGRLSTTGTDN